MKNENNEVMRDIRCNCGEWEQFPADMSRNKAELFVHVENTDDGEAIYQCTCGNKVKSQCD
jgi:hypothetical protein